MGKQQAGRGWASGLDCMAFFLGIEKKKKGLWGFRGFQRPQKRAWSWYQYNKIIICLSVSPKSCASCLFPLFTSLHSSRKYQLPSFHCSIFFSPSKCSDEVTKHCSLPLLLHKDSVDVSAVRKSPYLRFTSHCMLRGRLRRLMQWLFQVCYLCQRG